MTHLRMCGAKFCSMITQDVRDYAAQAGRDRAGDGWEERQFRENGGEAHLPVVDAAAVNEDETVVAD